MQICKPTNKKGVGVRSADAVAMTFRLTTAGRAHRKHLPGYFPFFHSAKHFHIPRSLNLFPSQRSGLY